MRIFTSQPKPGDEVEATLTKGRYFRHKAHTIHGRPAFRATSLAGK
jgi:hypothetical protein